MSEDIRPIRILEDINNTFYRPRNGSGIPATAEDLSNDDILNQGRVRTQIVDSIRGADRYSLEAVLSRFANNIADLASPVPVLEDDIVCPEEFEGIKLLASSADIYGRRPKVTLVSNIPARKKDELLGRLHQDGVMPFLDSNLPVVLRPFDGISPALFKYANVGLFGNDEVFVVEDDPYVAEVIRRGYPVMVFNPTPEEELAKKIESQRSLKIPGILSGVASRQPIQKGGALDVYELLIRHGVIKTVEDVFKAPQE